MIGSSRGSSHGQSDSFAPLPSRPHVEPIHLLDVPVEPDAPAGQAGAEGHLAVLLPRREDRRARPQRLRQVDAAADHGRARTPSTAARRSSRPAPPSACSSRSPSSTRTKDVRGNVEDGVAEMRALLDRFNELAANYSDETADEFARLQDRIDAADAWNLDTQLDQAMDALRLPPPDADVTQALRRRAPPRRALPAAARRPRPAAARRAHEPPRRRVGRLARAAPRGVQGHDRRGHPRSLLPRQRRGLDPRARPRQRASRSRATTRAGSSRSRSGSRRRSARSPRASARSRRSSSGCARTRRAGARSPRRA